MAGMQAVLTGDIVNSTQLTPASERKLLRLLRQVLAPYLYEFYRGDSFQVYQPLATDALKTALLCRTLAISIKTGQDVSSDIRISIGIGKAARVKALSTAKGEAFFLSGRAFDEIAKTNTRLAMATGNPLAQQALQVIADYVDTIFKDMTSKQASVIFELLKGESQQTVATKLKKSKSTINQHVSAGKWAEIEKLLQQYGNIVNLLS